jgi:hypothetical protein
MDQLFFLFKQFLPRGRPFVAGDHRMSRLRAGSHFVFLLASVVGR